ncbi:MAG: cyanophycin synthetase, partial [Verrucomicrobiota bacterium]
GEFNVRNAAMAISAARFYGVAAARVQQALSCFEGIARRQEVRGEARGVTVIDDFGHHPTAIRETLRALRHRYPGHRLWAIFEPRSNTTRRAVFQQELTAALQLADGVFIARIARLDQIPEQERLNPAAVVQAIAAAGKPAFYEPDAAHIIARLVPLLQARDVVVVFSNGGFEGIHEKLLARLGSAR